MKKRSAFTLIELMVVVAIIAILAAIAIPQYKKYQLKAKTTEAKVNIGAIRTSEEAYVAENDYYKLAGWAPGKVPGTAPVNFNHSYNKNGFDKIGFAPSGKVYYSYAVANSSNIVNDHKNVKANALIKIFAVGDIDGDATSNAPNVSGNKFGVFHATNRDPRIVDDNPGEF